VVWRVTGGVQGADHEVAERHLVLVAHRVVVERVARVGGQHMGGIVAEGKRPAAADVVVVDVGLHDNVKGGMDLGDTGFEPVQIALGVDQCRPSATSDQVAVVTQAGSGDLIRLDSGWRAQHLECRHALDSRQFYRHSCSLVSAAVAFPPRLPTGAQFRSIHSRVPGRTNAG